MNSKTLWALEALRRSDPADAVTTAQAPLAMRAELLEVDLDQPPRSAEIRDSRRLVRVALAAAAVLAVAVVVPIVTANSHSGPSAKLPGTQANGPQGTHSALPGSYPTPPSFGPSGTVGTSSDPHFASALARVTTELTAIPSPPLAVRVASTPVASLERPPNYPNSPNLIDRATFWSTRATLAEVAAFYTSHPPLGMILTVTGRSATGAAEEDLGFTTTPTVASPSPSEIDISIASTSQAVWVRGDVLTVWAPSKPKSELIGAVSSLVVTIERPANLSALPAVIGAPTVTRSLDGLKAAQLRSLVNGLPTAPPSISSCPANVYSGPVDVLTFVSDGHRIVATEHPHQTVACGGGVVMAVDGGLQPQLAGDIDAQVLAALGLPPNYGA